ncbi:unnamed protein product [Peniophora sp. CBMAI 1063]|nr:unnamed protein product [Peniophora sp. CBMAI 1063]
MKGQTSKPYAPRPSRRKVKPEGHIPRPLNRYILAQWAFRDLLLNLPPSAAEEKGIRQLYDSKPRILKRLLELEVVWRQRYPGERVSDEGKLDQQDPDDQMKDYTRRFGKFWREDFTDADKDDWQDHCDGWIMSNFNAKYPHYKYRPRQRKPRVRVNTVKDKAVAPEEGTSACASAPGRDGTLPPMASTDSRTNSKKPSRAAATKRVREEDDDIASRLPTTKRARKSLPRSPYPRRVQPPVVPALPSPASSIALAQTSYSPFTPTAQSNLPYYSPATYSGSESSSQGIGARASRSVISAPQPPDGVYGASPHVQMFPYLQDSPHSHDNRPDATSYDAHPLVQPSFSSSDYVASSSAGALAFYATPSQINQSCLTSDTRTSQFLRNTIFASEYDSGNPSSLGLATSDAASTPAANGAYTETTRSSILSFDEDVPSYDAQAYSRDRFSWYRYPLQGSAGLSGYHDGNISLPANSQDYSTRHLDPAVSDVVNLTLQQVSGVLPSSSVVEPPIATDYPDISAFDELLTRGLDAANATSEQPSTPQSPDGSIARQAH